MTARRGREVCVERELQLAFVVDNVALIQIIPELVTSHSLETILLVISNPVDALIDVSWKPFNLASNHVIRSGTSLGSSRFRQTMAAPQRPWTTTSSRSAQ